MSKKRENAFIASVHRHLPDVYKEKMCNPFRGGTPDVWYSGDKADGWIEYKWIDAIPKRANIVPELSPLQAAWLNGRHVEGRNVAVVVGCPEGCVVYDSGSWESPLAPDEFRARIRTKRELAEWIRGNTGVTNNVVSRVGSKSNESRSNRTSEPGEDHPRGRDTQ